MQTLNYYIISETFQNLCEAIELINSTMSNSMIPVFIVYVVSLIFGIFVNLQRVFKATFDIRNSLFLFFLVLNILFVIYCTSSLTKQAEKIPEIISKIMLQSNLKFQTKPLIKDDQSSFVYQYCYTKLDVANVLFTINWSLFATVSIEQLSLRFQN